MSSWLATLTPNNGAGCSTVPVCRVLSFGRSVCHCDQSRSMLAWWTQKTGSAGEEALVHGAADRDVYVAVGADPLCQPGVMHRLVRNH